MIVNDGFEDGFYAYEGIGELTVPMNWKPIWVQGAPSGILIRPEYKAAGSTQIRSGKGAVACHSTSATIDCALYRAFDVGIGTRVEVSVWMMKTEDAMGGAMRLGIDPTGRVDHTAGQVAWSDWYSTYSTDYAVRQWRERRVSAVSEAAKVVIFLQSRVDYKAHSFNSHFDDLRLEYGEAAGGTVDYDLIRLIVQEEIAKVLERVGQALLAQ